MPVSGVVLAQAASWYIGLGETTTLNWQLWFVYWSSFTIFAVICHRLALLPPFRRFAVSPAAAVRLVLRFFGWLVVLGILFGTIDSALANLLEVIFVNIAGDQYAREAEHWSYYAATLPASYLPARFSMVLPATAIDEKVDLRWSWERTRGNGWRLVVIIGLLPWALASIMQALSYEGMSLISVFAWCVVSAFLGIVEVVALSLSFWELGKGPKIERPET